MQWLHDTWGSVLTYLTAGGAFIVANQSSIISAMGALLLVARLIHDVPRAYETIMRYVRKRR